MTLHWTPTEPFALIPILPTDRVLQQLPASGGSGHAKDAQENPTFPTIPLHMQFENPGLVYPATYLTRQPGSPTAQNNRMDNNTISFDQVNAKKTRFEIIQYSAFLRKKTFQLRDEQTMMIASRPTQFPHVAANTPAACDPQGLG